jgi:hypothetical protein
LTICNAIITSVDPGRSYHRVRWVNLTGWAGLAIGNLQLVAPHDETVLAAGPAFERG